MIKNKNKFFGMSALVAVLINLILFLMFYIPNYILEAESVAWDYFDYFFTELFEFVLPLMSATLMLVGAASGELKPTFLHALWLSLPRFIYLFPYYYLRETAYGSDWIESVTISAIFSTFLITVYWLQVMALFAIMLFASKHFIKRAVIGEFPKNYAEKVPEEARKAVDKRIFAELQAEMRRDGLFNFDLTVTFAILLASAAEFFYSIIFEIIDAIEYFVEYAGSYRNEEIWYIVFCFAFILIEMLLGHIICYFLKKITVKKYDAAEGRAVGEN